MKIGLFLPNATFDQPGTPEVGGIETFAFTVGEALQKLGHEVILYGGEPKPGRTHRLTTIPLKLFPYWETKSIPDIGTRFQRLVQRLHFGWVSRHEWRADQFDLVLLSKPFDWPLAWWWKRTQPNLRVIMGFHGTDFFAGDRCFYKAIDRAFAVSPVVADLAEKHVGSRPVLIPNPTDVDFFSPDDSQSTRVTSAEEPFRIAASGRLVGWKGFHQLVTAAALLRAKGVNVEVTLAGDGPERPALQKQIDECGIAEQFTLCGRLERDSLRDLLRRSDAYVAPSIGMEAFSIAALEAGSVGLPLLFSNRIGLGDFLSPADFLSYPADDAVALGEGIETLIARQSDAAWSDRASRHARMRAQFSPAVIAQKLVDLAAL